MYEIQKNFTTQYLKHNLTLIEFLRKQSYDVAITTNQNYETFLAVAAGIPVIREGMFLTNIINQLFTGIPGQNNQEFPLIMWDTSDHQSFLYRLSKPILNSVLSIMMEIYYQDSMFAKEFLFAKRQSQDIFVVGHGVPGIRDYLQVSQQQGIFYPMTKDSSKFNGQLELSPEYSQFMSNHQKNVLVSFGTTHMPNEELCKLLVETFVNF